MRNRSLVRIAERCLRRSTPPASATDSERLLWKNHWGLFQWNGRSIGKPLGNVFPLCGKRSCFSRECSIVWETFLFLERNVPWWKNHWGLFQWNGRSIGKPLGNVFPLCGKRSCFSRECSIVWETFLFLERNVPWCGRRSYFLRECSIVWETSLFLRPYSIEPSLRGEYSIECPLRRKYSIESSLRGKRYSPRHCGRNR